MLKPIPKPTPKTREQGLQLATSLIQSEINTHQKEIADFQSAAHLSADMKSFNIEKLQKKITSLQPLLGQLQELHISKENAELAIYQQEWDQPPTDLNSFYLGTAGEKWGAVESIIKSGHLKAPVGSCEKYEHSQATRDYFIRIVFKF